VAGERSCKGDLIISNPSYTEVIPVAHDDLWRTLNNPFKGPTDKRVLRLDIANNQVELISKYAISTYTVRYIKKLNPIILINLPDGL
jgi:hypothetical protein